MNLEDLRSAQVDERGTDSLQPLRPTFYEEAAAYLAQLRERRNELAAQVEDPFDSEEVRQLNDELDTAAEVVEALYERRVGKLVKRASLAAAGMPADEEGLTEEERDLFGDLVDRIEDHRSVVLGTLEAEAEMAADAPDPDPSGPASPPPDAAGEAAPPEPEPAEDKGSAASESAAATEASEATDPDPEPDGGAATLETPAAGESTDRLTVRITASVGEIYGVDDRVYTLDDEDVVTLPAANAQPLLERGAAQRID